MTTEEFQKLVLEKFEGLEESVKGLEMGQKNLEESVKGLEMGQEIAQSQAPLLGYQAPSQTKA